MGKIKRQRLKVSRYSPTHIYSNGSTQENSCNSSFSTSFNSDPTESSEYSPNSGNSKTTPLENIKGGLKIAQDKVLCNVPEERMTGLNMLAAFALECKAAEEIVEKKFPILIAPLLKDPSAQVRLAAIGALRNMSSWESDNIIDAIIQQDVLQAISQLLKSYEFNLTPMDGTQNSSLTFSKGVANVTEMADSHHLTFIHATNVMLSLCECNEEALRVFNREGLADVLLKHISPLEWGYPISLSVADCLLCVSENNPKICSAILPVAQSLFSLVSTPLSNPTDALGLHFATVITGVLLNVGYWDPGDTNFRLVFEVLSQVLEVDAASLSETACVVGRRKVLEQMEHVVAAQLVAFEIFSNICCLDGEAEWEECDEEEQNNQIEADESMEIEDVANNHSPDSLSPEVNNHSSDSLSAEVLECIKFFQLIEKTQKKILLPSIEHFSKSDGENGKISEKFSLLQIRALQCFQNLVDCLPVEALGGSQCLHSIWLDLGQMFSTSNQADPHLLEATSGAMRAVTEKLSESDCPQISNFDQINFKLIFDSGLLCETASVRANLCRLVGSLGCAFVKHSSKDCLSSPGESYERVSSFVDFLVQVSEADPKLWVRAEALDVLIDLFSDDKTDGLAAGVRLVERLKDIQPLFKFNQQRKVLGDHKPLVLTVRDNLVAFIKYKGPRTARLAKIGQ